MSSKGVKKIAKGIRTHRKAKGWTVETLAANAGVNARHLYRIEAAEIQSPGWALLEKVAKTLGVELSELTG